jgi:DNA-binding transcriptional ArsR family regulator
MKSRSVMLSNRELAPFGIDRPTKSRGLATLEKAGLIKVDRKAGRWPTVTLLA